MVAEGSLASEAGGERPKGAMPLAEHLKEAMQPAGFQIEAVRFDFPRLWTPIRITYPIGSESAVCKHLVSSIAERFEGHQKLRSLIQDWEPVEPWELTDSPSVTALTAGLAVSDHPLAQVGATERRLLCAYVMTETEFTVPSGAVSEEFHGPPDDEAWIYLPKG